ncbi:MAG: SDR family oxidoreductase [Chitinophagaceae bacterium]|nr:SDR family oxidoreductase [Chitinophagaceae bacterium]
MDLDLTNKNAIVCGSTQGLGFASAIELALLGANVTLVARNEERLQTAITKLDKTKQQKHDYIVADFQYPEEVKRAIEKYVANRTVHILVNNTGGPKAGVALSASTEEFQQAFNSHLICNHILVQAVVPGMKTLGYGRIINIISTSVKQPIPGLGVSNTIRGAVASWSKSLAFELGPFGITVNNVLPGYTKTRRYHDIIQNKAEIANTSTDKIEKDIVSDIPLRRIGNAEEFGAVIAFLCSPAAGYISGINLPVDGGRLSSL